ncbi:MAG: D-alanyl-D-alanine carboxypeptidase/D-alanyl-D-alanine-endopeptidase [Acidobacteria bacterium RIFCSPLOWO2_12_FULL_65_11]|nr:MAG: D-alanyl-D-alanine carboxypeptidase/D-alanyl-D-alanine-endopeptidase [Acidobacteria bacterium RIFCSPLOWO2_02_FULL_64_15]OFW33452.1 MAG: D-alanyl-D-alanine carboxypeptidase/D-alanyl-D-alanine-endopeptidase [Acidobacteria bacterium RIFCSPLOWO2_12_FULL_65_11]
MRTAVLPSRRAGLTVCFPIAFVVALAACRAPRPAVRPAAPPSRAVVQLRRDINAVLAAPALASSFWGVVVKSLKTDETIYSVNHNKLLMPASNMKIVTLAAAADRLGWDYTYETRVVGLGSIEGGTLTGDLLVVGSGDPSLDDWDGAATRLFATWADQLKAMGVTSVTGQIIGDDNAFDDDGLGFGWEWTDLGAAFAARTSALQFNEGSAQVIVVPGRAVGDPAAMTINPTTSSLVIRNLVRTSDSATSMAIERRRLPGREGIELRGSVPLGGTPVVQTVAVDNPTLSFVAALRAALVANGIQIGGPAVDIDDLPAAPAPNGAAPLITYRSPPLSELAATLMKLSQNQFAEALFRTLGSSEGRATADGGRTAARAILQGWGIAPAALTQVDGSGLSRYNYVTPESLVAILVHINRDERLRAGFEAALAVAGSDEALARFKGTAGDGKILAKNGSMTSVRALSGYVTTGDGEALAFSILANNFEGPASTIISAMDAIVIKLAAFTR